MVKRFLITTALESTWRFDVPVQFLGEWCRRHDRQSTWSDLDAVVLPYHWDDRGKLERDYRYLHSFQETLLAEIAERLNECHGVNRTLRYWRILVGPWLGTFVQLLFDRWYMLVLTLQGEGIGGVRAIRRPTGDQIPNDMADFERMFAEDDWNEALCAEILQMMGVPLDWVAQAEPTQSPPAPESCNECKSLLLELANRLIGKLSRGREFFFISTYLPRGLNMRLQLRLGQLPRLWRSPPVPSALPDRGNDAPAPDAFEFEALTRYLLWRHMPTAYREGYARLLQTTCKLTWPRHPKAIFTSNSWAGDDVFKAWAAGQVELGVPLVIGQHGGNYGMARWSFTEDHQLAIADCFLSWGWEQAGSSKVVPVGNFKGFGKRQRIDPAGDALMVEMALPQMSYQLYSVPVAGQWLAYFDDQCRFVQALPEQLRQRIVVRMFPQGYGWDQRSRWTERFPRLRIDGGRLPIEKLVEQSRIYISTYNSTTYLESLSLNVPTLMFWNPEHWELRPDVQQDFDMLQAVGIFHVSPESAAHHLEAVWDQLDAWWQSERTQQARVMFCHKYARLPARPEADLAKLFRSLC